MLSSALSIPGTGINTNRDKSQKMNTTLRSKSQPPIDHRSTFTYSMNSTTAYPMKTFFENLLHLTPHRHITNRSTIGSQTRILSNLSSAPLTDRSSRMRMGHPSVVSSFSVHSTNVNTPLEHRRPTTLLTVKFRRAGKLVLFAIYWCKFARQKTQLRSLSYQSYLHTAAPIEKYMFDKSNFKIEAYEIVPVIREYFQQPIGQRKIDGADQIRQSLDDIKPFARLPKELQDRLLQNSRYECFPERRVIVRQDEPANCFYIILSGSALPTYKRATDGNIETLDVLKRGSTFGEKGLMTNSTNNFTITSKTTLELLSLWKDDFKTIFMTDERYCSKDDLKFLKNVPVLRDFPIERLHAMPKGIQHCHFTSSELVVKDSRRMKHIFIVRKGSLAVWKRLEPKTNGEPVNNGVLNQIDNNNIFGNGNDDDNHEATGDNTTLFSEIRLSGDVTDSKSNINTIEADFRLSRLRRLPTNEQRVSSVSTSVAPKTNQKFPGLIDKRDRLQVIDYNTLPANTNETKLKLESAKSKRSRSTVVQKSGIYPDKVTYLHVKTLNEGQYFGLTDILFPDQPALTLISNDCECLLLNKSLFLHLAPHQYKQNLRRNEIPFPTDDTFYQTYNNNESWKKISKQVYLDAFERISERHPKSIGSTVKRREPKHSMLIATSEIRV